MKQRVMLIIGLILVVVGAVFANLANFAIADTIAFAVTMFGAGMAIASMYNKRDVSKPTWMVILSLVLVGVGALLLGFGGFAEKTMTTIITSVFGLVSIIAGLIVSITVSKKE